MLALARGIVVSRVALHRIHRFLLPVISSFLSQYQPNIVPVYPLFLRLIALCDDSRRPSLGTSSPEGRGWYESMRWDDRVDELHPRCDGGALPSRSSWNRDGSLPLSRKSELTIALHPRPGASPRICPSILSPILQSLASSVSPSRACACAASLRAELLRDSPP